MIPIDLLIGLLGLHSSDLPNAPAFRDHVVPPAERMFGLTYLTAGSSGFSLVLDEMETVDTVQIFDGSEANASRYAGALPLGLNFSMTRTEAQAALGVPDESGEEGRVPILGETGAWDAYLREGVRMHIRYHLGARGIQLVSLTKPHSD